MVSEPLRHAPEARVIEWIDAQPLETLYLSAMAVAELRAGVALLPSGRRRTALHENLEKRVLPFDLACTSAYAELLAKARKAERYRDCRCLHCCGRLRQRIYRCHTRHKPIPGSGPARYQPLGGRVGLF